MSLCECGCGQEAKKGNRFIQWHHQKGANHYDWKGGRTINFNGYALILDHGHPRASKKGYVYEHIMIAERALGKPLPNGAQVHHHSETQLVICESDAYHKLLHQRTRAYNACGWSTWLKCEFCGMYDDPANMYVRSSRSNGWHRECRRVYRRTKNASHRLPG